MNPAAIALIIKYVQLAIAAAPVIEDAVKNAKDFITNLFLATVITVDQQNAIHAHIDAVAALFQTGRDLPAHWTVQPDPVGTVQVPATPGK